MRIPSSTNFRFALLCVCIFLLHSCASKTAGEQRSPGSGAGTNTLADPNTNANTNKGSSAANFNKCWKSYSALLEKEPVSRKRMGTILPYELTVPKNFDTVERKNYFSETIMIFGPERSDRSRQSLLIAIIPKSRSQKEQDSSAASLASAVEATHKLRPRNWKTSDIESGDIAGLPFLRQSWQGLDPARNVLVRGFFYVGRKDQTLIMLSAQDLEESSSVSLKLSEAIVQSFKPL